MVTSCSITSLIILFTLSLFFPHNILAIDNLETETFARELSPEEHGLKSEKLTHLHFYFHDILTGSHPSAVMVVQPTNQSSVFGGVVVIDDALTVSPDPNSKLIGKAQGLYAGTSQSEVSFSLTANLVFFEGKYNGSSLSIFGQDRISSTVREIPIVGGSGIFRFARGYARFRTHTVDGENAVLEYDVWAFHY